MMHWCHICSALHDTRWILVGFHTGDLLWTLTVVLHSREFSNGGNVNWTVSVTRMRSQSEQLPLLSNLCLFQMNFSCMYEWSVCRKLMCADRCTHACSAHTYFYVGRNFIYVNISSCFRWLLMLIYLLFCSTEYDFQCMCRLSVCLCEKKENSSILKSYNSLADSRIRRFDDQKQTIRTFHIPLLQCLRIK